MKTRLATAYSVLFAFFILTVLILPATSAQAQQVQGKDAHAEAAEPTESAFIKQFKDLKYKNSFSGMKFIIKSNKAKIPAEVEVLLKQANAEGINDIQRIILLDLAYQIAKMHQEHNAGDAAVVEKLEALLDVERRKKKAKRAALAKIKKVELVPGNFVLNVNADEMEKAGVAPVIYPHWVHRSYFRCKVCHENLEVMKRGANKITHEKLDNGGVCGACHNGETSFSTTEKEQCARCHLFNTPEADKLIDYSYYDEKKFTDTAKRLGSKWDGSKLIDGKFPTDKYGFLNFVKLDESGAFEPLSSLGDGAATDEGVRETEILFQVPEKFSFMLKNVLWSHKIHSTWINCSICHESTPERERIFTEKAGETRVSMVEIKEGKSCGTCHGRVSFPVSDCKRCHNHKGTEVGKKVIVRESIEPEPAPKPAEESKPKKPGSGLMKSNY